MPTTPIPGGYSLSTVRRIDTVEQRRAGRGQTLVLMNGLAGYGPILQSPTSVGIPTPPGFVHYQIPTQGSAQIFREPPSTIAFPANGAAASDGYRVFQFGGSFEDTLGSDVTGLTISTQSNRCTIVSPGVGSTAATFNLLEVQSDNTATGTDTRLFSMGGWVKDPTSFSENARETVSVINTANLAEGYWATSTTSLVNPNSENDGDIFLYMGGRFRNDTSGYVNSSMFYFSMATGTGSVADQDLRTVSGGNNLLPRAAGAGSATDGSRIVIGGGNQHDINGSYGGITNVTANIYQMGFRVPVLTTEFGDLTQARTRTAAGSDGSRAVFVGGCNQLLTAGYYAESITNYSTMDKITISTPGTATTFGEIQATIYQNYGSGFQIRSTGITPSRAYGVASAT